MSAKVLVIEDNETNLELASYLLRSAGHTVVTATDGLQGFDILRQEKPDLVLCDLQMPVLDGYGFLKLLKDDSEFFNTPVVAVTAFSMPSDRAQALSSGFNGYLSKPIDPENFIGELNEFLPVQLRISHRNA